LETYNIALTFNKRFLQHACVTIMSLLDTNKELNFRIYILYEGLEQKDKNLMISMVKEYRCDFEFIEVDDSVFNGVVTKGRQPTVVYYRLLLSRLVEEERIFYFDTDIVINGSIKDFYNQDFEDNYLVGVEDWRLFDRHEKLNMNLDAKYFNSGSTLLNLKKIKEDNIYDKCIECMKTIKNLQFLDQDVINSVVNGKWKQGELKYNTISSYQRESFLKNEYFEKDQILDAFYHPIIVHYTGGRKPWHYISRSKFRDLYWKYLKMTPFKDYREPDRTVVNIIKKNITVFSKKLFK